MAAKSTAPAFSDQDMLQDALASEKFLSESYNIFTNECANPEVHGVFMSILQDQHDIQFDVFTEMQKRGWYQVQPAEKQKIQQTKTKFGAQ
jgi:spore coat protein CotF